MNRRIVAALTFLFFANNAVCQDRIGLKGGVNFAYQSVTHTSNLSNNTQERKPVPGYQLGIFNKLSFGKRLSFVTEANFSVIGARRHYLGLSGGDSFPYYPDMIGYIDVPLLLQYDLKKFYVSTGPSASFRLFAKVASGPHTADYRPWDLAVNTLAGYRISRRWDANLRYSYGLLDINQDFNASPIAPPKIQNRYFALTLLYYLK